MEKRTLEELLQSLNDDPSIKALVQGSPVCHKILDPDLNLRFMSNSGVVALEIENIEDFYGKPFPPDSAPRRTFEILNESLHKAIKGEANIVEYYFDVSGKFIWYRTIVSPFFDDEKNLLYVRVDSMDITQSKEADTKLRESEERFRTIVSQSPWSSEIYDPEGNLLTVNEAWELLWDLDKSVLKGFNILSDPECKRTGLTKAFKKAQQGITISIPAIKYNPEQSGMFGGLTLWIKPRIYPIINQNGKIQNIVLVYENVTDQKEAEDALKKRSQQLLEAQYISKMGGFTWDIQTGETTFSDGMYKLLKYDKNEVVSIEVIKRDIHHPDDSQRVVKWLMDSISKGLEKLIPNEYRLICKDGVIIDVQINGKIEYEDGKALKIFGTCLDVTDRKRAEEIEKKVTNMDSIGLLAGGIAHDFNNLLTAILGNISIARITEDESEANSFLLESEDACIRARNLTKQLLTFSKGGDPVREQIDIASLVAESSRFSLRGSNVKPEYQIEDNLRVLEADSGQISQVINNLTINANQAMPNGGILLFKVENFTVESQSSLPLDMGEYVKISVKDEGDGISEENLSKIFNPYFSTKHMGSGLGLATAYSIISKHGGHIEVASKRQGFERGTVFNFYLPSSKEITSLDKQVESLYETSSYNILVMDDEVILQKMCCKLLEKYGHKVVVAGDGADAMVKYKTAKESGESFDLVISDLTVPGGMGGKELCTKLHNYDSNVVVIASSGYSTDQIMQTPEKYGFEGILEKPYRKNQILNVIYKTMQGKL